MPKYVYPKEILTVSKVEKLIRNWYSIEFNGESLVSISSLNAQKKHKKTIFGAGFLLSTKATEQIEKLEKLKEKPLELELSQYEYDLIKKLDEKDK